MASELQDMFPQFPAPNHPPDEPTGLHAFGHYEIREGYHEIWYPTETKLGVALTNKYFGGETPITYGVIEDIHFLQTHGLQPALAYFGIATALKKDRRAMYGAMVYPTAEQLVERANSLVEAENVDQNIPVSFSVLQAEDQPWLGYPAANANFVNHQEVVSKDPRKYRHDIARVIAAYSLSDVLPVPMAEKAREAIASKNSADLVNAIWLHEVAASLSSIIEFYTRDYSHWNTEAWADLLGSTDDSKFRSAASQAMKRIAGTQVRLTTLAEQGSITLPGADDPRHKLYKWPRQ